MNDERDDTTDLSRRDFLKTTAAGTVAAASSVLPGAVPAAHAGPAVSPRIIGANDRIGVAVVGVGGMGSGHLKHVLEQMPGENATIVAVADVWEKARKKAQAATKLEDKNVYADYRKLLEQKDVDAVIVATPDHWHATIAIAALETGRHVYVEKPMTRYLKDGFALLDAVKRTKCLVQLGTQGCTEPKWQRAREIVQSGKLGRLLWAQGSYCRNNPHGEWNYEINPRSSPI